MSLQDRLSTQDATHLLSLGASLSLVTAASWEGIYNFPLMLFGIVAHSMHSSTVPFRQFLILLIFSAVFDIFQIPSFGFSFITLIAWIVLALKAPIFFTCLSQFRERGGDLRWGQGGWTFPGLGGATQNWSMPGGFGGGQQPQSQPTTGAPPPPASFPSSGGFRLGGDEEEGGEAQQASGPPPGPAPGRNGYQTIA